MGTELEHDQVVADYAAGRPVAEIESAYGLTREEIEYLVADAAPPRQRPTRGGLALLGFLVAAVIALAVSVAVKGGDDTPVDPSGDAERVCVEEFIPQRLKAPSTAEFSAVTVASSGDVYTVTGKVDAQNSFGAMIRSSFTCVVRDANTQWVLQSATVS